MRKALNQLQENFLATHQVFNTDEWEHCCALSGHRSRNQLAKLSRSNRIRKIRNRLYSVVPSGVTGNFNPPAILTAAKLTPDAVLGYRSALAFYGMSRNVHSSHTFLTRHRIKPCRVNDVSFQPCSYPQTLQEQPDFAVETHSVWNTPVQVVSKERLLVDTLDRLELSGGWEEIVNAFAGEDALDWKKVIRYVKLLAHPAATARLGFMLEQYKETMRVPDSVLASLEKLIPETPEYFFRSRRKGRFVKRWNLYVPDEILKADGGLDGEF